MSSVKFPRFILGIKYFLGREELGNPVVLSLVIVGVCLVAFVFLARKISARGKKLGQTILDRQIRMVFVQRTIDQQFAVTGEGTYTLYGDVVMDIRWVESNAHRGDYGNAGTRVHVKSVNTRLTGLEVHIRLRSGRETSQTFVSNSVRFKHVRPDQIEWVRFSTESTVTSPLGQFPGKETE